MPLHCYGNTCDVEAIQSVASEHGLPVIYDACHSFGIEDEVGSVLRHGDISVVSFHATKVFNTFEGGLLVTHSLEMKQRVDQLKNFGFVDEVTISEAGINGKMSEFSAAMGLLQLAHFDAAVAARKERSQLYRALLAEVKGLIPIAPDHQKVENYSYFPILVEEEYPLSRDEVYELLQRHEIYARRYFYPLISEFPDYRDASSAKINNLPVASAVSRKVLCLPLYPDLPLSAVRTICALLTAGRI